MPNTPATPKKRTSAQMDAAASIVGRDTKADPPSNVSVDVDLTFTTLDMTDAKYWLKKNDLEYDPGMAYHWCNSDPRVFPKRTYAGWKPVEPTIRRGDTILCARPQEVNEADKARIAQVTKDRENAPMARYEQEASRFRSGGNIDTFDGSRGRRDGL